MWYYSKNIIMYTGRVYELGNNYRKALSHFNYHLDFQKIKKQIVK